MYQVSIGNDVEEFATRGEAIAHAKKLSSESRQPVFIQDGTGRERMTYQHGELDSYTYETRQSGRPRVAREDRRQGGQPATESKEAPGEEGAKTEADAAPSGD